MMSWNHSLFLLLNASQPPGPIMLLVAEMLANAPVVLAPALLVYLWVAEGGGRRAALIATGFGLFAGQAINWTFGLILYQPRPFMAGIGHTWLAHVADNGFPSDHATLAWSLGIGLMLTGASRRWGACACLVGLATGWARVYLGVHFPLDVLASAPAGLLAGGVARAVLPPIRRRVAPPLERLYEQMLGH